MTDRTLVGTSLDAALARVGTTPADLFAHGGSVLEAGTPYLVGSLAQGLGNRGSDVDIHLFVPGLARPTPPFLFFLGQTPVDVEHYPAEEPGRLLGGLSPAAVATALGDIALAAPPDRRPRTWLTRWCTALPLRPDTPPVFDRAARALVTAHLLRATLSRTVLAWGTAELVAASGADAAPAWALCTRSILDLACVGAGVLPAGDKWLPARMRLAALPGDLVDAATRARTGEATARLLGGLGLPAFDPLEVTRLEPDPDATEVRIGRRQHVLTQFGRLEDALPAVAGSCRAVLGERSAGELLAAVTTGLLRLAPDEDAISERLSA